MNEHFIAIRQDESHRATAQLRKFGIDITPSQVRELALKARGEFSDISIMQCVTEFFREVNAKISEEHDGV